jgi:PAS domain S-box-containing protein
MRVKRLASHPLHMNKISADLPLSLIAEFWFLTVREDRVDQVSPGLAQGFAGLGIGQIESGLLWWEALALDDPEAARAWREAATGGKSGAHYARAGGGSWWFRLSVQRKTGTAATNDRRWVLAVEDVTEEREEHERARLEAEHFHALIQRSSEGISLFDKTSKILYESPSNKRIHGYSPEEMEGRTLMSFCHPDDTPRIALRFQHLAEAPGVVETEVVRFRHKQGHYIYLEGTVLNATDDPRLGAMVNNFREVTGRLEAERELRRAKTSAEEAQRLQQHFLTNLSHEFKTPLTLIRGPLEVLRADAELTKRTGDAIGVMVRNVERLDALISELVDLARLEAGAFALKAKRHGIAAFLRAQAEHFAVLAQAKAITLKLELADECEVFFDAPKLEKVVGNLLSNAVKFSPTDTEIRLSLYVRTEVEGGGEVEVAVTDQGAGMDEETRGRVFERFFQGDAGLARGHEGMGIGMAIAREMVEMHGGALTVESEPGVGSTFTFTLPLGCEHLDPDDIDLAGETEARPHTIGAGVVLPAYSQNSADGAADDAVGEGGARPSLLLVEDNQDMRAYLRMHLDLHYDVREAENGEVALAALAEAVPDIILSDVMMPRLNGLELSRRVRSDPRWAKVPLLLLSAKGGVDHRLEGLEAGADDYLAKPFSVPELLQRLRKRLPEVGAGAAGKKPPDPAWVGQLEACLEEKLSIREFNVEILARGMGYSPRQLRRKIVDQFGLSPSAWLLDRRLKKAHALIEEQRYDTVAQVAHAVGLSPSYFSRRYRQAYACTEIRI